MNRETLREMARNRWPVIMLETGNHGEIGFPFIREIKVIYATPAELRQGMPRERLAVVLADRSGHSFTEVQARQIRLPSPAEAADLCLNRSADAVRNMLIGIDKLREVEEDA